MNRKVPNMKMLSLDDLRAKGIPFSRQHIHRLVKAKKFPAPVKIGANTNAWPDGEIDRYLESCIQSRDQAAA